MTSFTFIFVDVPEPVWKKSTIKLSSCKPSITSWADLIIESAIFWSNRLSSKLVSAADCLIKPKALIKDLPNFKSEIGKFNCALLVLAPYKALDGTSSSPMESFSNLIFIKLLHF